MSETDDTDDLLLIPPDFFTVDADLQEPYLTGPYFDVVDTLIAQVNKLEDRINFIESTSDVNFVSKSLDYSFDAPRAHMSGVRKYNSSDDIRKITRDGYFESTQSTPHKPQTRFKLSSIDSSPSISPQKFRSHYNSIHSKQHKSPTKLNGYIKESATGANANQHKEEMLQEIDQFISNLHMQKMKNSEKSLDENTRLTLDNVNYLLKQIESQEKFHTEARDSFINSRSNNCEKVTRDKTWRCGDNKSSVPNYNYGMRDTMYNQSNKNSTVSADPGPSTSDLSTESLAEKTESVSSSSESTQVTALPNVSRLVAGAEGTTSETINPNSIDMKNYKKHNPYDKILNANYSPPRNYVRHPRRNIMENEAFDRNNARENSRRLLSLSNLWNRREEALSREVNVSQKLEEEQLRRQHCEQLIQQLQGRALELQERLAVAFQIDEAKDDAILRFHKAWEQVAIRLQTLTKERDDLEKEINEMAVINSNNLTEAAKKVAHFENEASKALTMAHANQEKLTALEKSYSDLMLENQSSLTKIAAAHSDYDIEAGKVKQLSEIIAQKEIDLSENKNVLAEARNEIAQSKRAIEICQVELTTMKTRYTHLELVLNEKQDAIKSLELHNKKLSLEVDTHKKIQKDLQHELNKAKEANDKTKIDLRNFYQDQVEIVVRDKLKEFQSQLDRAETSLQDEMKKRELAIAKSAAVHIQQITDKHSLEVSLLEEKHSEEVRLYQVQLSQAQQHVENLHYKFQHQQQRRSDMAQQLHRVMEAQWHEALKIINNGRSPFVSQDQDVTINQLNILKSKSHSNVEEVLLMDGKGNNQNAPDIRPNKKVIDVPPLNFAPSTSMNGDVGSSMFANSLETPLSSRPRSKQQIEVELQKYVQMLLNKTPGVPVPEPDVKEQQQKSWDQYDWQPNVQDDNRMRTVGSKDKKHKPPWK